MTKGLLLAALLALPALAGCLDPDLPLTPLAATLETNPAAYTFAPPVAFDGAGNAVPVPLDAARLPVGVASLVPGTGGEPNLGVTRSGAVFVTSFDQTLRSRDKGATWEVVQDFRSPGGSLARDGFSTSDPMLWVDVDTDRVYVNHMHPAIRCTYMMWSDDEGESWTQRPMACATPEVDHQKVMTAKPGPRTVVGPQGYPNVLYICVNKRLDFEFLGLGTTCMVSLDGGMTYPYEREVWINDQMCGNVNGHPAAWPDGTVGVVLGNLGRECQRPLTVGVSEDNGLTWDARQCDPELGQKEIDADLTVTPDGTAYVLYRDDDQLAHLLRSTDKFETCERFRVAPPDHTLSVFAGIASGDDGRVAMAYLGTTDPQEPGATPSNATPGTRWHLYVTTSLDADAENPTFTTTRVTPDEDPVQVGCVWLGGGGGGPYACRNLLDFIDMVRDADGRWYVAITDGCTPRNGCTGTPGEWDDQSRDRQVAVVVQDRGESLLSGKGVLPSLGLQWPAPEER